MRRFRALMAAAALLLFVGGGAALVVRERGTAVGTARGALKNYLEVHGLEFQGQAYCPKECAQWSRKRLGFEAPVPTAYADQDMVGGRACSVNGRPVAHYLLKDGRALYVFKNPIGGCESRPAEALAVAAGLQAKVWNEQGRGYVLVEPSSR